MYYIIIQRTQVNLFDVLSRHGSNITLRFHKDLQLQTRSKCRYKLELSYLMFIQNYDY